MDKIQDVAVRYQGQFGLMSVNIILDGIILHYIYILYIYYNCIIYIYIYIYSPCEEFIDPERRCPMQSRKFHGPYYKLDF